MSSYAYKGPLPPERFNLAHYCLSAASKTPNSPALIVIDDAQASAPAQSWTFAEVESAVKKLSTALRARGLKPGDRVLIRLDNRSEYAFLFFAAMAAGFVALPVSSQLSEREIEFLLHDSGAALIALDPHLPISEIPDGVEIMTAEDIDDALAHGTEAEYADTKADDPAFLVYTSGTTADPKGVLHAHRSAWGRRPMIDGWYGIGPSDRILHAGAFNWTYTLGTGLQDPWASGAASIIYRGTKDPAVWPILMEKYQVTMFAAVPSLYRQILKYSDIEKHDLSNFRHGLTAGEALPEFVREEWQTRTGKPLYEALGMSEISTYISSSPSVPPKPGTVGRPQQGRSIAILAAEGGETPLPPSEEGLLCVHRTDPGLMLGYWNRAEEEAEVYRGEWFCGGDLARMDEEGYVCHLGRNNDVMNALGYRVSPFEIEQVIGEHDTVSEAAAAEIEVKPGLSIICVFTVLKEGEKISEDALIDYAKARLADYKVPKQIVFVSSLPKTPNGKTKRANLKELFKSQSNH